MPVLVNDYLQSDAFNALTNAAQNFCGYIENETTVSQEEFAVNVLTLLTTLYAAGLQIPELHYGDEIDTDVDADISDTEKKNIISSIYKRIPFSFYNITLYKHDLNRTENTALGDLGDDIADIYLDLKRALLKYNSPYLNGKAEAVFTLAFGFSHHWGDHCIDAMHSIHHYLQKRGA